MSQNSNPRFGRLIAAMPTAFDDDLNVDINRTITLGHKIVEGGVESLLVLGTTGENPTISESDKIKIFQAMASEFKGSVPIIANVGSNCTSASVEFARKVEKLGVDGLMLVVPFYNKPPQEGIYQHFKTIANAVDKPIILYNIPGRTSRNMTAETTLRLAHDCDNIIGIKEASGMLTQIDEIIDKAPDDFAVYSGDDALTYDLMKLGGAGVISTSANVAPELMKQLVDLLAKGDYASARKLQDKLLPLMTGLFAAPNPILCKQALNLRGIPVGGVRLPLVGATPEQTEELKKLLQQYDLI